MFQCGRTTGGRPATGATNTVICRHAVPRPRRWGSRHLGNTARPKHGPFTSRRRQARDGLWFYEVSLPLWAHAIAHGKDTAEPAGVIVSVPAAHV